MAARRRAKVVFPADIHQIAADIRRQALRNPDKDPVVRRPQRKRTAAKRKTTKTKARAKATRRGRA